MNDPEKDHVKSYLESFGFDVQDIPENQTLQRADLRASKDGVITFVEVKSRLEDQEVEKVLKSAVPGGDPKTHTRSAGKRNHFSRLVEGADRQLRSTASDRQFRAMWFVATAIPGFAGADEQMKATLLGTRHVMCKRDHKNICLPCYYAGFADFYRFRDIDAVVIQGHSGAEMVVNEHSPRMNKFRKSPLYSYFAKKNATREVGSEEKAGKALIIDVSLDRNDDNKILSFLRQKYQTIEFRALVLRLDGAG